MAYHPDEPFNHLPVLIGVVLKRDFVESVMPLAKVELDRSALEDAFRLARCLVDDGWDATIC